MLAGHLVSANELMKSLLLFKTASLSDHVNSWYQAFYTNVFLACHALFLTGIEDICVTSQRNVCIAKMLRQMRQVSLSVGF